MQIDSGAVAWALTGTALVMIMTPAVGFSYGGLVRRLMGPKLRLAGTPFPAGQPGQGPSQPSNA